MPRYYFDIRDGEALCVDEEGLDLLDQGAAEVEAALSLADMARDRAISADSHTMAIEVRGAKGALFRAGFMSEGAATPTRKF